MANDSKDDSVLGHIDGLVKEEERLYAKQGLTDEDRNRVEKIKVELDQYWDLLRQRRALREFGRDPKRGTLPYADKFAGGSRSLSPYGRLQRSRHPR